MNGVILVQVPYFVTLDTTYPQRSRSTLSSLVLPCSNACLSKHSKAITRQSTKRREKLVHANFFGEAKTWITTEGDRFFSHPEYRLQDDDSVDVSLTDDVMIANKIDRPVRGICTFAVFFSVFRPFCRFTLVYEGHFVLCYKEKTRAVGSCYGKF